MKRKIFFILVYCLAVSSCNSDAQTPITFEPAKIPETNQGKVLKAWFESYNTGDAALVRKFVAENYSPWLLDYNKTPENAAKEWVDYFKSYGPLVIFSVDTAFVLNGEKVPISALLTDKDQKHWKRVSLFLKSDSTFKIRGFAFQTAKRPTTVKAKHLSDKAIAKSIKKQIEQFVQQDKFAGTVLIAKDGKPFMLEAYGLANREKKIANTINTKFDFASMGKMFTSVAIAQLVQAGKFSYTDTVINLLPNYPNKEVASKITVHQLLTHTSGLTDLFNEEFDSMNQENLLNVKDWYQLFVNKPLEFEPGSKYSYSNSGYIVLGAIIEEISGVDYYTYIKEHITNPLGMNNTAFYSYTDVVADRSIPYTNFAQDHEPTEFKQEAIKKFRGASHGGGYSTVNDLLKFAEALKANKLLNKEFTELIITGKVKQDEGFPDYAYGFNDNREGGIRTVGHGGGINGANGYLDIYWENGYVIAVLANVDPPAATEILFFIRDLITIH
jgi:CubicO group peptidase (beta-lactamase class C family)